MLSINIDDTIIMFNLISFICYTQIYLKVLFRERDKMSCRQNVLQSFFFFFLGSIEEMKGIHSPSERPWIGLGQQIGCQSLNYLFHRRGRYHVALFSENRTVEYVHVFWEEPGSVTQLDNLGVQFRNIFVMKVAAFIAIIFKIAVIRLQLDRHSRNFRG